MARMALPKPTVLVIMVSVQFSSVLVLWPTHSRSKCGGTCRSQMVFAVKGFHGFF